MKRFLTLFVFVLSLLAWPVLAQEIDESFVFVDENGAVIPNGATVTRTVVESNDGVDVIYSGLSVKNMGAPADYYLKVHYVISQIDNGSYQICFPTTCNSQSSEGTYVTSPGQLMGEIQDIQSEWFPNADGSCIVNLSIEVLTKSGGFPPQYSHVGDGPSLTLEFIKGGEPQPQPLKGDVNGDGEVNIADINAVIEIILNPND